MPSPYHSGELAVQKRAGVRAEAEDLSGMYRDFIPASVAEFLGQHTFAVLASEDAAGNLWASAIAGPSGILSVPNEHHLRINLDRLNPRLDSDMARGNHAGLLVMEFNRRLRIRINGKLTHGADSLSLHVSQFYGNCTKYIQRRVPADGAPAQSCPVTGGVVLTDAQRALIARSDTFFIATQHPRSGADASHRGGRPGFVTVADERTLVWPDYRGNNMFNTLGNLELDPRAGLLFIDFDSGVSLQLAGQARADFGDPTSAAPTGRSLRFDITAVRELAASSALRYALVEAFQYNPPV